MFLSEGPQQAEIFPPEENRDSSACHEPRSSAADLAAAHGPRLHGNLLLGLRPTAKQFALLLENLSIGVSQNGQLLGVSRKWSECAPINLDSSRDGSSLVVGLC